MAKKKKAKKKPWRYCVRSPKGKANISCHSTKTAAKKAAKNRRAKGLKSRVVKRRGK